MQKYYFLWKWAKKYYYIAFFSYFCIVKKKKMRSEKRNLRLLLLFGLSLLLTACIKEEPKNDECDIMSAWVEGAEYEGWFYRPTMMRVEQVSSNTNTIVFYVRSTDDLPPMPVYFSLSPGATVTPASGSLQEFSQGPVTYTVTSEDGEWSRTYSVRFQKIDPILNFLFSFEHVDVEECTNGSSYHVFYEMGDDSTRYDYWASGNAGVAVLRSGWTPEQFPTYSTEMGFQGKGACLNTQETGPLGASMGKPIAAGNLFLGQFDVNYVLTNALQATKFGIPTDKEPLKVSGWYKYRPGTVFTNVNMEEVPGRVDKAHFYAVFYRNHDDAGNPVVLDGTNVLSSEYIVSKAQIVGPPPTDEWTHFEMTFEGGEADPELLSNMGYNFTVVFSSSKDGDLFEGAVGSTLMVDEVIVTFK